MISRRLFLRALGAVPAPASAPGVGYYTFEIEPGWLEVVRRPLPIRRLPSTLAGRTLAHLSDIHVGPFVSDEYLLGDLSPRRRTCGPTSSSSPAIS